MIEFPPLPSGEQPVWDGRKFQLGARSVRVLAYSTNSAGWDDDLTNLHEAEAGDGTHPIDTASRARAINALRTFGFPVNGSILEIGCSSGFLLRDLQREFHDAEIVGADIVVKPLERLGASLKDVPLIQMDLLRCPMAGHQFDAVIALNVLEHIEDDVAAVEKMAGLLKRGGMLILEVPQGPGLYDYFDAYLRHFRRYRAKELASRIVKARLEVRELNFLGFVAYLPFVIAKKLSRMRFGPKGEKCGSSIEKKVRDQIQKTSQSRLLGLAFAIEGQLRRMFLFPIGIRCTVVAIAPNPGVE
jgi:SAM-dependent methyltransferase